jgi:hypothetical protein
VKSSKGKILFRGKRFILFTLESGSYSFMVFTFKGKEWLYLKQKRGLIMFMTIDISRIFNGVLLGSILLSCVIIAM